MRGLRGGYGVKIQTKGLRLKGMTITFSLK